MDDRTFDERTAALWMKMIEAPSSRRDAEIYPRLNTWLARNSATEILEIGAGQGICSDKIELQGKRYTGLEPSPFLVDRARQLYGSPNRTFTLGSAYALPFAAKTFDAAFSVLVWHLLGDIQKAAAELGRVLKNGGHFSLITANPAACALWMAMYDNGKLQGRRFEGDLKLSDESREHDVLYFWSLDEITHALVTANLNVTTVESLYLADKSNGLGLLIAISGRKLSTDDERSEGQTECER